MLAQLGCDHVQGYGIARPMPFEETMAWMDKHAPLAGWIGNQPQIGRPTAEPEGARDPDLIPAGTVACFGQTGPWFTGNLLDVSGPTGLNLREPRRQQGCR